MSSLHQVASVVEQPSLLCAQSEAWREWKRSEAAPATPAAVAKQPATPLPPNARSSPRFRG